MEKKNILIIILAVIVLVFAGLLFFNYRNSIVNKPQVTPQSPAAPKSFEVADKKIEDTTKPFTIDVTYPQITGLDGFNAQIQAVITKQVSDFKTASLANGQQMQQNDPQDYAKYPPQYDLQISYTKGEIDANVASVVFNVYEFEGGANGANYFIPVNYDQTAKKDIVLTDLFPNQPGYLQTISAYCIKDLTAQITKGAGSTQGTWIAEGAGPQAENYSVFLINQNSLVFYFAQAQVAAASFGSYQVTMPR